MGQVPFNTLRDRFSRYNNDMSANRKTYIAALIGFAWCFGIIVLYFAGHKPFSPEQGLAVALAVWRLLVAAVILALGGGLGTLLYRRSDLPALTQAALQAGLGTGILALGLLILGTLALPRWLLWLLPLVLGGLLFKPAVAWARQWRSLTGLLRQSDRFGRWIAALTGLSLLAALFVALAPPLKWDALVYHLVLPQAYLDAGRVAYLPWMMKSGMPQNTEMLYTWAVALGGGQAAAVLGWMIAVTTAAGLLAYTAWRLDLRPAWAGAAALLAGFSVAAAAAWAYVDWMSLFLGLGMLVSLDLFRRNGERREAFFAGAFAGLALATKYPAGVLGLAGLAALAWHLWRRRDPKAVLWQSVGLYALGGGLPVLPWLVKNLLTTGNPLYPLFFTSGAMSAVRTEVYTHLPPFGNWADLVLLPLRATYLGFEAADGYSAAVGPLLLGLGALAWLGRRHLPAESRPALENGAAIAVPGLIVWIVGNQLSGFLIQTRFYFGLFSAFAVLSAAGFLGLDCLRLPTLRLGRIVSALVLLVSAFSALEMSLAALQQGAPQTVLGIKSEQSYLTDNLGWYWPAVEGLRDLPAGSKTLLLLEPRSYYCAPLCSPDETLDRWKRDWLSLKDPDAILTSWRAQGYTHILFYKAGEGFMRSTGDIHHTEPEWQALDAFLSRLPDPVEYGGVYERYEIRQ